MEQVPGAELFIGIPDVSTGGFSVGFEEILRPQQAAEIFFSVFINLDAGIFFFIDPLANDLICNNNLRSSRVEAYKKKYSKKYFIHSNGVRRVSWVNFGGLENMQV